MKRLTITLCLSITLAIGCFGVGWSDFWQYKRGQDAFENGDYETAFKEWMPLAISGIKDKYVARAQNDLGVMYHNIKDHKTATKWFTLSAEQGYEEAMYWLGLKHEHGLGVLKDIVSAHMWYNLGALNGMLDWERDRLTQFMTPSQLQEAQTLARECVKNNYKGC